MSGSAEATCSLVRHAAEVRVDQLLARLEAVLHDHRVLVRSFFDDRVSALGESEIVVVASLVLRGEVLDLFG